MKNQWRPFMWLVVLALLTSTLKSQELLVRKNIDLLNQMELASYEHAIQLLKDRSDVNPYDKAGYAWQAWVHNMPAVKYPKSRIHQLRFNRLAYEREAVIQNLPKTDRAYYEWARIRKQWWDKLKPNEKKARGVEEIEWVTGHPGQCEHGKDLFLTWHRAQFYYFERILQDTDPEGKIIDSRGNVYSTRKVGVPFWNYTSPSSGKRYPVAFERKSSVLYHKYRAQQTQREAPLSKIDFSATLENDWEIFAGGSQTRGVFEIKMHDYIHGFYVGGGGNPIRDDMAPSMYSPRSAAYDPIFYSFHAYIDFALDYWLEKNGIPARINKNAGLRSEQPEKYHPPGYKPPIEGLTNMGQVGLYLSSKTLGFRYEMQERDLPLSMAEQVSLITDKDGNKLVFGTSAISPYFRLYTYQSHVRPFPKPDQITHKEVELNRDMNMKIAAIPGDNINGSYQVDVYIHPAGKKTAIALQSFRQKYLASWGAMWVDDRMDINSLTIDLAQPLQDLLNQGRDGQSYRIIIAITQY